MCTQIKFTFLGDLACDEAMIKDFEAEKGKYDFNFLFQEMKAYFAESDYVLANLETPISYDNKNLTWEKWRFCAPYDFALAAYKSGIDFLATANNHCLDRGVTGISSTIKSLDEIGIEHTGVTDVKRKNSLIADIKGIRVGLLSYTYGTNAFENGFYLKRSDYWRVNLFQRQELSGQLARYCFNNPEKIVSGLYNKIMKCIGSTNINRPVYERRESKLFCRSRLRRTIKELKKQKPDIIIMYMHAGGQYNETASKDTKKLVSYLHKRGINIIAGTHEHVVHDGVFADYQNGKAATYSLGDFNHIKYETDVSGTLPEYSIAWNVYLSKREEKVFIEKMTYSIIKSFYDLTMDQKSYVIPVYDLYMKMTTETEKEQLWSDMRKIAMRFSGKDIKEIGVKKEYDL